MGRPHQGRASGIFVARQKRRIEPAPKEIGRVGIYPRQERLGLFDRARAHQGIDAGDEKGSIGCGVMGAVRLGQEKRVKERLQRWDVFGVLCPDQTRKFCFLRGLPERYGQARHRGGEEAHRVRAWPVEGGNGDGWDRCRLGYGEFLRRLCRGARGDDHWRLGSGIEPIDRRERGLGGGEAGDQG